MIIDNFNRILHLSAYASNASSSSNGAGSILQPSQWLYLQHIGHTKIVLSLLYVIAILYVCLAIYAFVQKNAQNYLVLLIKGLMVSLIAIGLMLGIKYAFNFMSTLVMYAGYMLLLLLLFAPGLVITLAFVCITLRIIYMLFCDMYNIFIKNDTSNILLFDIKKYIPGTFNTMSSLSQVLRKYYSCTLHAIKLFFCKIFAYIASLKNIINNKQDNNQEKNHQEKNKLQSTETKYIDIDKNKQK